MSKLGISDYARILMRPNQLKCIILSVTSRCNARCKMCIYWDRLNKSRNELTLLEIQSMCQNAGDIVSVILTGGEPFLRKDLDEVAYFFVKYNKTRLIHISTMGYATETIKSVTKKMVEKCKDSIVTVDLSIDGVGSLHDEIREVPGLFDKICETYFCLDQIRHSHKNLRIKVNTVISRYNQNNIASIVDFVKKNMRVDDHSLSLTQGDPKEKDSKDISLEHYRQVVNKLETTQEEPKIHLFERLFKGLRKEIREEIMHFHDTGKLSSPCRAIKNFLFIDEEGGVYPCLTIKEKIGDLREEYYDLRRILNSSQRCHIDRKYAISTSCACDWDCGYLFNVLYDPRKYKNKIKYFVNGNKKTRCSIA